VSYPSRAPEFTSVFYGVCVAHLFSFIVFMFLVRVVMSGSSFPPVGRLMSYLFLFAYSGVQHILCCFCFVFLRLVFCVPIVASLSDYPFMVASSVFSTMV